jgi:hypothetical protein
MSQIVRIQYHRGPGTAQRSCVTWPGIWRGDGRAVFNRGEAASLPGALYPLLAMPEGHREDSHHTRSEKSPEHSKLSEVSYGLSCPLPKLTC